MSAADVWKFVPDNAPLGWRSEIALWLQYVPEHTRPAIKAAMEQAIAAHAALDRRIREKAMVKAFAKTASTPVIARLRSSKRRGDDPEFRDKMDLGCIRDFTIYGMMWAGYVNDDGTFDQERAAWDELARRWKIKL